MLDRMAIIVADITTLEADAIVNAANSSLLGGGGVDGAIHHAAGPALYDYCAGLGGCETGQAKITPGFNLPARHIIHTVGPIWHGGERGEHALLAACYANSLRLAVAHGVTTIAFPAISTGVFGFPADEAAVVAATTTAGVLAGEALDLAVTFCAYSEESAALHRAALRQLFPEASA
jgi:O-acetyl-ADP-ribose deacetylase (regulator of RNase III)